MIMASGTALLSSVPAKAETRPKGKTRSDDAITHSTPVWVFKKTNFY